uniref:Tudor domain-containing protein n=1 Tax=Panagrolaimus davidi TaxID=227884 RepID=A0A914Q2D7_9BILA
MGDEERQSVSALPPKTPISQTPNKTSTNKGGRKTPIGGKRKVSEDAETPIKLAKVDSQNSVKKPLPNIEDEIPKLNAKEQAAADSESNTFYPQGARVFAIFGKDYYPAIVDESDGLGRYKIFFTEDNSRRTVPRDGVFPLHYVKENYNVNVIGELDEQNERPVYEGKILTS